MSTPLFLLRIRSGEQSYIKGYWPTRWGPRFVPMWLARLRQRPLFSGGASQ